MKTATDDMTKCGSVLIKLHLLKQVAGFGVRGPQFSDPWPGPWRRVLFQGTRTQQMCYSLFIYSRLCRLLVREMSSQHNVKLFSLAWILELGFFYCLFVCLFKSLVQAHVKWVHVLSIKYLGCLPRLQIAVNLSPKNVWYQFSRCRLNVVCVYNGNRIANLHCWSSIRNNGSLKWLVLTDSFVFLSYSFTSAHGIE